MHSRAIDQKLSQCKGRLLRPPHRSNEVSNVTSCTHGAQSNQISSSVQNWKDQNDKSVSEYRERGFILWVILVLFYGKTAEICGK
jgi:gas vesicle protein